jgi:hypothetical protein
MHKAAIFCSHRARKRILPCQLAGTEPLGHSADRILMNLGADLGLYVLAFRDPDDIQLELTAPYS